MNIIIAILDQDKKTLGYKADSFWSIMQKEDAKTHSSNEANQIDTHLIPNLLYFLNGKILRDSPKESYMGCTKLFIALEDVTGKQTIIYSLHRVDHHLNGQDRPWIADTEI